jgi:hypothetical protein
MVVVTPLKFFLRTAHSQISILLWGLVIVGLLYMVERIPGLS